MEYLPAVRENPEVVQANAPVSPGWARYSASPPCCSSSAASRAGRPIGRALAQDTGGRGPWPLVLAGAVCLGLVGIDCGVVALTFGGSARRDVISALCVSLMAPLAVGMIALSIFASMTLGVGI